jgi:hypothetical protein
VEKKLVNIIGKKILYKVGPSIAERCARLLLSAYEAKNYQQRYGKNVGFIELNRISILDRIAADILVFWGYLKKFTLADGAYIITEDGEELVGPYIKAQKDQGKLFEE